MSVFFTRRGAPPSLGKKLSDYAEGDIIKIPENGTPVEFYVAKHNYESGLNGAGRTLVVRKKMYDNRIWHTSNINAYANSNIDNWFNNTYKNLFDSNIRTLINSTKFYYTPGNGNNTVDILERSIFALSLTELGGNDNYANIEGSVLPIANILKTTGINDSQWTRSPRWTSRTTVHIGYFKYFSEASCTSKKGSRPAFTLPSTTKFDPDTNIIIV